MSFRNPPVISFYTKYLESRIKRRENKVEKMTAKGKTVNPKFIAYTEFLKKKLEIENERIANKSK